LRVRADPTLRDTSCTDPQDRPRVNHIEVNRKIDYNIKMPFKDAETQNAYMRQYKKAQKAEAQLPVTPVYVNPGRIIRYAIRYSSVLKELTQKYPL
jgi:hypothetical protein